MSDLELFKEFADRFGFRYCEEKIGNHIKAGYTDYKAPVPKTTGEIGTYGYEDYEAFGMFHTNGDAIRIYFVSHVAPRFDVDSVYHELLNWWTAKINEF